MPAGLTYRLLATTLIAALVILCVTSRRLLETTTPEVTVAALPLQQQTPVLIALSRPVYRLVDEREYTCPALRGRGCTFTTLERRFGEADAIIDVLKDPRKVKPLSFKPNRTRGQLTGVIISEKDTAKKGNRLFKANRYDFEVGYNRKTAAVWRPFMCNELSRKTPVTIAEALLAGPGTVCDGDGVCAARPPRARLDRVAAFVSNCVAWRLDYLRSLRKHVRVDSFGACLNNNKSCGKSGCDKVVRAADYKFVFSFENTREPHYVTEKVRR